MSNDVECPYCGIGQEICHDDGYGYSEDETHEQQCGDCGKMFAYKTSIIFYYEASKADCLNGAEHKMEKVWSTATYDPPFMRCEDCGHETKGRYTPPQAKEPV